MEHYQGVKFNYQSLEKTFSWDSRLLLLNKWAYLFSQLGLAPVHSAGTYGNHSYRGEDNTFIITRSGMTPTKELNIENYTEVTDYENHSTTFFIKGVAPPSSESFLHNTLYQEFAEVGAILHGHCTLLHTEAQRLKIPTTPRFHDYGTRELADSALELARSEFNFFILKDHGFVALGRDIPSAGQLALKHFGRLISLLRAS
jgi:ribulose-5-phosphate 4-epimerase/fuculose-1-phosphate aldolase